MVALKDAIYAFQKDTENSVKILMDGNDKHLDLILSIKIPLDELTVKFELLNEQLYEALGKKTDEELLVLLPILIDVNKSCVLLKIRLKKSKIYSSIKESSKRFFNSLDFFQEMIYDLKNYRFNKKDDFSNIMNELNAL